MSRNLISLFVFLFFSEVISGQSSNWGNIANSEFEGESVKSTLFFGGNWRNGVQFYDYNPSDNRGLFTMHPSDARHLGWSESQANRDFAVNTLIEAGINIINISYWGLPGTDNWAHWSPMQSSTQSHDELFNAVLGKNILVAPFIESFASTNSYDAFSFMDDFPGVSGNPSPELVIIIEDLIDRYLINPANSQWPAKWAKLFDRDGIERYMISIIHVASNKAGITDQEFAQGFGLLADLIYENTNIRIGFALDILPLASYAPGAFKATAGNTGNYLYQQSSILAVQCFIPEIWQGKSDEYELINWKSIYSSGWINTGIPWIHDISSGYDASVVFPESPVYGNNQLWRDLQDTLILALNPSAFAFNAWNGYTEGFAGVPTAQYGDATYNWICELFEGNCWFVPEPEILSKVSTNYTEFRVFPNPANNTIEVYLKNIRNTNIEIRVYSLSYQLLIHDSHELRNHSDSYSLNISNLRPGIYILILEDEGIRYTEKIVISP